MPATIVPIDVALTCPRCKLRRLFVTTNGTQYRCQGCEWLFTLGTPTVAAPAVPASTVAAANNTGTVVSVVISGGTLTFVFVNGVQVGTTAGTYLVPVGGTISITYSVAPTWTWALPLTSGAISLGGLAIPLTSGGTNFALGQNLLLDTGANAEVVSINGAPTGTSLPITGAAKAHSSNAPVGLVVAASIFSGVGEQAVPNPGGWGF
jgi:hypothetical protein